MNKNRILFIISALMIIVMLLAVANRMDILKKDKDNTQAVLKNNDNGEAENDTIEGGKNGTSEIHIKKVEDIPEYEMGEEVRRKKWGNMDKAKCELVFNLHPTKIFVNLKES